MSEPLNPPEESFHPLRDGLPVVVRMVRGADVLCVVYRAGEGDPRVLLDKPLEIAIEPFTPDPTDDGTEGEPSIRMRFVRWMPLSDAQVYIVSDEHIMTVAPVHESITNAYMDWAPKLYPSPEDPPEGSAESAKSPDTDDLTQLLAAFTPTGKPN